MRTVFACYLQTLYAGLKSLGKKRLMNKMENKSSIEATKLAKKRNKWDDEIIIQKGRELFNKKGFELSMRDIAKALDTQASSLYRHVQSKRELWFAITIKDFEEFAQGMNKIAGEHYGSAKELLKEIAYYFLRFAREDFNRFKLMFLYEPPKDNKIGPFEEACNPDSLRYLIQFCDLLIKEEHLTKIKAEDLAILYYSQILGYTVVNSPINDYLLDQDVAKHMKDREFDKFIIEHTLDNFQRFI